VTKKVVYARPITGPCFVEGDRVLPPGASSAHSLPAPAATDESGLLPTQRNVSSSDKTSAPRSPPGESTPPPEPQLRPASGWPRSAPPNSASVSRQISSSGFFDFAGNSLSSWTKNPGPLKPLAGQAIESRHSASWSGPPATPLTFTRRPSQRVTSARRTHGEGMPTTGLLRRLRRSESFEMFTSRGDLELSISVGPPLRPFGPMFVFPKLPDRSTGRCLWLQAKIP
jgi:hypothetical protein